MKCSIISKNNPKPTISGKYFAATIMKYVRNH